MKLKCFFGFHKVIEIVCIARNDKFNLNYFHCKHCGYDALDATYRRIYGKNYKRIIK